MNNIPRQQLYQLIATYGPSLCDDPRRCEALLKDLCAPYRPEVSVLVGALKEKVAAELLASQKNMPQTVLLARLTKRIRENLALTEDAARWAVESWALALGVISLAINFSGRWNWHQQPTYQALAIIMQLREPRYTSFVDLMKRRVEPSFAALATAGFQLADSFFQLHAKGLCYRDISFGNVFFDPNTGDILICDNDNVSVDGEGKSGILGTPRFMAPEIVRGEAIPCAQTDLFSLSVLLFYMFMVHHPAEIHTG